MMLLTILLYKKGWVKPVQPAESDSRPPIFWISITVVVMLGIISLIRWMGW
ncbi:MULTISPECIES: ABC transporter permease [Neisseria]|nr:MULTISPECIES: ABC transporter permease [Neisseria]UNV84906.1 ABC transporter permease [Neisseria macacae ATCC 33926]